MAQALVCLLSHYWDYMFLPSWVTINRIHTFWLLSFQLQVWGFSVFPHPQRCLSFALLPICFDCHSVFPCRDWKHLSLKLAHFQKTSLPWHVYSYLLIYFINLVRLFHVLSGLLIALCSWGLTPTWTSWFMLSHSAVPRLQLPEDSSACLCGILVWSLCLLFLGWDSITPSVLVHALDHLSQWWESNPGLCMVGELSTTKQRSPAYFSLWL